MAGNGAIHGGTGRYRIGAVAEMTGVPPETLRAWERRYGAVEPERGESGFRMYSQDDLERLVLIKRLCDRGNAVGSIAALGREELESRLARCERARRARAAELVRAIGAGGAVPVVVLDPGVAEQLREAGEGAEGVRVVAEVADAAGVESELDPARPAVLVLHMAHLGDDPAAAVERLLGRRGVLGTVVIFQFATRQALRRLAVAGAHLVKGPVDLEVLARAVREAPFAGEVGRPLGVHVGPGLPTGDEPNPEPRFTPQQLGRLREVASSVDCECPHHLSSLVKSLLEFEAYCARCEDLHEEDAAIHARLYRETGAARMVMERALAFLAQADGLES
ncbi:MAG: MerR family transcriptional regulator [Gemmatimonadetes bacterium]|nr:MerR family transcriptional regulator [Gemmatimonadota bacterium]